tara:strand:- start:1612 stop:1983 length:372 start_codon:yes stop_codon:yes gene_type:complete
MNQINTTNSDLNNTSKDRSNIILTRLKNRVEKKVFNKAKKQALRVSQNRINSYLSEVKNLFNEEQISKLLIIYSTSVRLPTLLGFRRFSRNYYKSNFTEENLNKEYYKHLSRQAYDSLLMDLQ